jgi:hypothetical protein
MLTAACQSDSQSMQFLQLAAALLLVGASSQGSGQSSLAQAWTAYSQHVLPPLSHLHCLLTLSSAEVARLPTAALQEEAHQQRAWAEHVHSTWLHQLGASHSQSLWALATVRIAWELSTHSLFCVPCRHKADAVLRATTQPPRAGAQPQHQDAATSYFPAQPRAATLPAVSVHLDGTAA